MLQRLIITKYIVDEFLAYRLHDILTLDTTQSDPPETENFVIQPDPTRPMDGLDPNHHRNAAKVRCDFLE